MSLLAQGVSLVPRAAAVASRGVSAAASVCAWDDLYEAMLGQWLWRLYRFGPMLTSFGFWSGLRDEEVCARLTSHTEVMDWLDPATGAASSRCVNMIQRSFGAFEVTIHVFLYCLLLMQVVSVITAWYRRRHMEHLMRSFAAVIHDASGAGAVVAHSHRLHPHAPSAAPPCDRVQGLVPAGHRHEDAS